MKKTFKQIKQEAAKRLIAPKKSIAIVINKSLTIFAKAGSDIDAIKKKYSEHSNNYNSYSPSSNYNR